MTRRAEVVRETKETTVKAAVNLDGVGEANIRCNIKYLTHMLNTLAHHSLIDINIEAKGDLIHHIAEDVAICLGAAIKKALGEEPKIRRFGSALTPMDDALASAAIDLSGRTYCKVDLKTTGLCVEDMIVEDIYHFIRSFSEHLQANIHLHIYYGENDHHKVEAAFKALALALRQAVEEDQRRKSVPSAKGAL
ncbi:MAG: imidazoleglycerol-phosphate dehydratase HisB [Nitrososphaerales archaeon]